ncbi:MAG: hypothetical protein VKK42_21390, partial [Lyngbya sp.]|nr:hypothetical protein [Lyngbya sp.]
MKHKLLSGLTAMVLVSSLSVSLSSHAEQAPLTPEVEEDKRETETVVGAATQPETTDGASNQTETHNTVVKVGEYQSNSASDGEFEPIATIQAHLWNNRQAATLYVRNIPVLTFVEETAISHQSPVTSHQLLDKREQGTSAVFPTPNSQLLTPNSDVEETEQGIGNREQGTGNRQEARVKREQVT